ncbi:SPW repeat domain-containing protein [Halosolutus gelatinilyticus]|uniref:SPW repeat domain-containing protein n=1 Tax=Halosolutus gelatinilyticus TaxID=2931975 RepID=UPI001FF2330E|nr:hypothetical protein [Halosolutus gelatinilyticus]
MTERHSATEAPTLVVRTAGVTAVIGVFILFSSVVFTMSGLIGIHNVLVGAAIATIASYHAFRSDEQRSPSVVIAAVLAVLGLWMIASPFVFGVSRDLIIWLNVATGVLVTALSIAGVYGTLQTSTAARANA